MNIVRPLPQIAASLILLVTCTAAAEERIDELSGPTMGTTYHIKVVAAPQPKVLHRQIEERLAEINALMSTYVAESDVSRFNRSPADEWFSVSLETLKLVESAQRIARRTEGALDITVGPLVRLWNFGAQAESGTFSPPSDQEIQQTLAVVGFKKLETRLDPPALLKTVNGLEIDLSAIAKGYAVDQIAELLFAQSVADFMVEVGGEVRVSGSRAGGGPWQIGIESPDTAARRVGTILQLRDQALASSGDYRNFHEHSGTRYSHTIDPRTGRPVAHDLAAVSVLSADCTTADALATALLVLGPVEGEAWAEEQQVDALLMSRMDGGIKQTPTGQMETAATTNPPSHAASSFAGTWLTSVIVFAIALIAMSVGVLLGRRRIQGSCGGLAGLTDEQGKTLCEACTNPSPTCQGNADVIGDA